MITLKNTYFNANSLNLSSSRESIIPKKNSMYSKNRKKVSFNETAKIYVLDNINDFLNENCPKINH